MIYVLSPFEGICIACCSEITYLIYNSSRTVFLRYLLYSHKYYVLRLPFLGIQHISSFLFYLEYVYVLPLKIFTFPISAALPILTTDHPSHPSQAKNLKHPIQLSPEASKAYSEVQRKIEREVVQALPEKNTRMVDEQKLLEERLRRLEQEISHSQVSSNLRPSAGKVEEPLEIYRETERRE